MSENSLVLLGYASRAHGLKGHAIFNLAAGQDSHLEAGHKVWLKPETGSLLTREGAEFTIEEIHYGNDIRVKLEGVLDRTALEKILPFEVYCERSQFPELDEGEFYIDQLLGLTVVTPEGKAVGKMADFYETPAQLVFTIRFNNGTEMDLPYVEQFFVSVDLEAETVTVNIPQVME